MLAAQETNPNPNLLVIRIERDSKNHGISLYNILLDHPTPHEELELGRIPAKKQGQKPKTFLIATVGEDGLFKHEVPADKSAIFYSEDGVTGLCFF